MQRSGSHQASAPDPQQAYFQSIEVAWNRLRGRAQLLSAADYQLVRRWHEQGVPLHVVTAALEEVFERRQRTEGDRINSLRYCAQAVDDAWRRSRALQGPARRPAPPGPPAQQVLAELVSALPVSVRPFWAERVLALAGAGDDAAVEEGLRRLDGELLAAVDEALPVEARDRLDADLEKASAALAGRFTGDELAALRERMRPQHLRRLLGLPVLSLYGPTAEAAR